MTNNLHRLSFIPVYEYNQGNEQYRSNYQSGFQSESPATNEIIAGLSEFQQSRTFSAGTAYAESTYCFRKVPYCMGSATNPDIVEYQEHD